MRQQTHFEAACSLEQSIAAAGIAAPAMFSQLRQSLGTLDMQCVNHLISMAWNNGYASGAEDQALATAYPPVQPTPVTQP